jgi:Zn-dependent protease/predicted transcriptional regulator
MSEQARPPGLRVGQAFGIPIYVHASWLLVFGLVSWTLATGYFPGRDPDLSAGGAWARALVASLLFFGSVLLHELGHSVVALRSGVPIDSITLFVFGGVSRMAKDPDSGRVELRIAAAGPAVSLVLAAVFFGLSLPDLPESWSEVCRYLAGINLAVALFNLVPAFPLDGGRLMRGLLWRDAGKLRATRLATRAGTVFAWAMILLGAASLVGGRTVAGFWYLMLGWFLKDAAEGAWQQARMEETLAGLTVQDAMAPGVQAVPAQVSVTEAMQEAVLQSGQPWYPVTRGAALVGVVRVEDMLRLPLDERDSTSVQALMRPLDGTPTLAPEEPLLPSVRRLAEVPGAQLLVVADGRLVGLLRVRDVAQLMKLREGEGQG